MKMYPEFTFYKNLLYALRFFDDDVVVVTVFEFTLVFLERVLFLRWSHAD